jgi:aspartyl-tRNA(Asn)/glutamyl-tRNA(Gln) amidotransferase subunit C
MATKLSRPDVLRVAELAHLTLTDAEVETFARQLEDILDWVNQIQQADTDGVEPTAHASEATAAWREDAVAPSLGREDILERAPEAAAEAGLFRVPTVL